MAGTPGAVAAASLSPFPGPGKSTAFAEANMQVKTIDTTVIRTRTIIAEIMNLSSRHHSA